ncbi:MAG: hypothetical protein QMD36_02375 [Candidatus Aenigmarchaeota archaeon]|nr:hypothetical protein [Candidatus Aenigmarchaeota archaeon]
MFSPEHSVALNLACSYQNSWWFGGDGYYVQTHWPADGTDSTVLAFARIVLGPPWCSGNNMYINATAPDGSYRDGTGLVYTNAWADQVLTQ